MGNDDLAVEFARQSEQINTLQREMKELKSEVKTFKDIALSVQSLALSVKTLTEDTKDMKADIAKIKNEPASSWKNFKWLLVGIVSTGILGGIVAALLALIKK